MTRRLYIISTTLLILIGLVLLLEFIRDCSRNGDFIGYIAAGNLVLAHKDIYSTWLNTWPPFFSIFCVPLSLIDSINRVLVRFIWLAGSLLAMYYIIKLSINIILHKSLSWGKSTDGLKLQDPIIAIPLLILLRFIMENLANLQINIFILLLVCLTLYYFINGRYSLAGFFLAFSISLKVYPVFLLFYLIYKREWAIVIKIFLFLLMINIIPFFIFGFDTTLTYYTHWYKQIASNPPTAIHLNQSIFGLISRLVTSADPENNFYINFLSLNHPADTYVKYLCVLLAAIYPIFLFRNKLAKKDDLKAILEYSFIFSIIPLISTLAWKAYFIFLWFPYLLTYILIFRVPSSLEINKQRVLKFLFILSVILNVLTSDGIIGKHLSDILQSLSCITVGTIILVIIQLIIYVNIEKFNPSWRTHNKSSNGQ